MKIGKELYPQGIYKPDYKKELIKWLVLVISAFIVTILIRAYLFELVSVHGPSMKNTLATGQRLFVEKTSISHKALKPGEIIVFREYERQNVKDQETFIEKLIPIGKGVNFIKRIIAVPGDEVNILDGKVFVNKKEIIESYILGKTETSQGVQFPLKVPPVRYFVMGDNRPNSEDSRVYGFVDAKQIEGRVIYRVFPFKDMGSIK